MFVRFVTPHRDPDSGAELGFFHASWFMPRATPRWLRDELRAQFDWYNANLAVPDRLARHFRRRRSVWGVCWFRPEAGEMVERAHYCAWLLTEAGVPVRMIRAPIRREIIWRDDHQIVCKPTPDLPRAFA